MSDIDANNDFLTVLGNELKQVWQEITNGWRQTAVSLRNGFRKLRQAEIDYVVVEIGGTMPERAEPPRSFWQRQLPLPEPALSIEQLNRRLTRIAEADNVRGLLLICNGISSGSATIQNIRRSLERLKEAGKTVVVYTPYLDLRHYYLATAADRIIVPPSASFEAYGLHSEAMFLKPALEKVGIGVEAVQISPYKSAPNTFIKEEITPEQQEQMTWLLDDLYDQITAAFANGRSLTQTQIQELMNQVPMTAEAALAAGLVDDVAYQDELETLLTMQNEAEAEAEAEDTQLETDETAESEETPKATLLDWENASRLLAEKVRKRSRKFIGVVSMEGSIMMGRSQNPPIDLPIPLVGGATAGEQTLVYLLRQAEQLDDMAGLIFHVDSPGGSALASDLIGREIQRLQKKKPVLVYMGNTAASGGYYVSAHANHIMSQPLTVTGSIGVFALRLHAQELYNKVGINRVGIDRGSRANLFSGMAPLTDDERAAFHNSIVESYQQFKQVVSSGRNLPYDELDEICNGRVWTGRQALDHKLVDSHGDFTDAVQKLAELAELPDPASHDIPVINLFAKNTRYVTPRPFKMAESITNLLAPDRLQAFNNKPLFLMPYSIKF
ncbi:signal peptide peptidase SppA [Candidatus Leptofilum sp.]|uniref:signal peptide peptidase SppA n=1 Tax=Candidatus Leptofilum sp. TaxID=3241576 RepID=UPI003B59E72E